MAGSLRFRSPRTVSLVAALELAAATLCLAALVGCGGVGGGGGATPPPYDELKSSLERAYSAVDQAIQGSSFDRVPALCVALGAELDRAENASKGWGILEREKMNLALATARNGLKEVSRTAPASGDPTLLEAQLRPVGEAVQQAEQLLEQAAAATKSPS